MIARVSIVLLIVRCSWSRRFVNNAAHFFRAGQKPYRFEKLTGSFSLEVPVTEVRLYYHKQMSNYNHTLLQRYHRPRKRETNERKQETW